MVKFFYDSKSGALIPVHSAQQLKINSHFGVFDTKFGERQLYDDVASHALICMCELFGNILFLYLI